MSLDFRSLTSKVLLEEERACPGRVAEGQGGLKEQDWRMDGNKFFKSTGYQKPTCLQCAILY